MHSRNGRDILNIKRLQRTARIVLPTILVIIISIFLLKEIDPKKIPETLSRVSFQAITIGFVCYCLLVFAKTLRFRTILRLDSSVQQVYPILALHTFWGNLLPMRTGDISYVYLMQRRQNVEATQGIASLMVASLIDLVLLVGLMVVSVIPLLDQLGSQFSWTILFFTPLLIGIGLLSVMVFACIAPELCKSITAKCARPLLRWEKRPLTWIVNNIISIVNHLTVFRLNTHLLKVWAYSLLCLIIRFGFQCYLVSEMGVDIPLIEVLFALAFTNGFNLLPIQSVANFGTTEFPFAWLLNYFGTSLDTAIATGISLHLLILLYCLPLGIYGFLIKPKEE